MTPIQSSAAALAEYAATVYEPTDLVEVRCFRGADVPRRWWLSARALPELAPELSGLNADGWDVYAGANPRIERREGKGAGGDDNVAVFRTLFADWDGIGLQTVEAIVANAGLPRPTMLVESGHGVHGYWRLATALEDDLEWRAWMRGLIAAVHSDPKIKDPARIMRLPGFDNCKSEPVACRIVHRFEDRDEWLDSAAELGVERLEPPAPPSNPAFTGDRTEPAPSTLRFIHRGASAGNRNQMAFVAACDLAARGWTEQEALPHIVRGALACGLPAREAETAVKSAFSKPREPGGIDQLDTGWAAERMARGTEQQHAEAAVRSAGQRAERAAAAAEPGTEPADERTQPAFRPSVVNYVVREAPRTTKKGEDSKPARLHVAMPAIRRAVKTAMGGWPRSVNGILFAYDHATGDQGGLPSPRGLRFLGKVPELFAWVQEQADVSWAVGQLLDPNRFGGELTAVGREELHAGLAQWADPEHAFSAVELVPHHPPVAGAFYVPCTLPEGEGAALAEFLDHLNPATAVDRDKLLALLLTLVWGGPPGKRPLFALTSKHGRGAGKTSTAQAAAAIVGGAIHMREGEDFETFLQRLLSDDGLSKRVGIIDNLKAAYSSGALEALITSPTIQGKRLYHGGVTRPNLLTWIITANTPRLSDDIAQRGVVIELGQPRWGAGFDRWLAEFMAERRAELIADLLAILRGPRLGRVAPEHRDRFEFWQPEVLERIEGAGEVAASIQEARRTVSADREQAEDVAAALDDLVQLVTGQDPAGLRCSILRADVAQVLHWEGLARPGASVRQVTQWLGHLVDVEPLRGRLVEDDSRKNGRRWLWIGADAPVDAPRTLLDVDRTEAEWKRRTRYVADGADVPELPF